MLEWTYLLRPKTCQRITFHRRDHNVEDITHQSHQECTGEKATSITKFGGGFPLQARANGREDCDRNWLPDSHGTDSTTKQ